MGMSTTKDKVLSIIERIVESVIKENGNKEYVSQITKNVADSVESDPEIQRSIMHAIRDLLTLIGPIQNGPSKKYHETQRDSFTRKEKK